jgi:type IV secretory pathway TrbD component
MRGRLPQQSERIDGYESPIHRALWERILTMGAPRWWASFWLILCLWLSLLLLMATGLRYAGLPLVAWALGQGLMVLLTAWDPQWDTLMGAHLKRLYKSYYDAG